MPVELRAVIASKQGLSCAGYFTLSNRTAHLRRSLYVSVHDGEAVFLPKDPHEHFPVKEIEEYYLERVGYGLNESIGAGGGEVVFALEGPAADEAAETIHGALVGLDAVLGASTLERWAAAMPEKVRYLQAFSLAAQLPPAYRPERTPQRPGPPQAFSERERRGAPRAATLGELLRQSSSRPPPRSPNPRDEVPYWSQASFSETPWNDI